MTKSIRLIALPILSAGLIGGAALGLAGTANAAGQAPSGPGYSYSPAVKAKPAPTQRPGWHNHHGQAHVDNLTQR